MIPLGPMVTPLPPLAEDIEGVGRSKLMALTDWILGGLRAGSNLGVEMRGMLAPSWRGLYMEDWGGGEHAAKALLREMMGLLGGESAGGLGGRLLLGGVRGG